MSVKSTNHFKDLTTNHKSNFGAKMMHGRRVVPVSSVEILVTHYSELGKCVQKVCTTGLLCGQDHAHLLDRFLDSQKNTRF